MAQAMLDKGGEFARGKRGSSFLLSDEIKRAAAPLILSTTYPLNHSATKKLVIGLQPDMNGHFDPVIKLINREETIGIALDTETWPDIVELIDEIMEYYNGDGFGPLAQPDPAQVGQYKISFTTSYGKKAIGFDRWRKQSDPEAELLVDGAKNRKKHYHTPPLLMQKQTFEGLIQLVVCVDERIHRLRRYTTDVNKCFDNIVVTLRTKIPDVLPPENLTISSVQEFIRKFAKDLKLSAQNSGLSLVFLEHYFDIIYAELTALCVPLIMNELKSKKIARRNPLLPAQYGAWR